MKTKNMRKKALVSSVAMLLVALVALSGATYAWFSTNTVATVSGLNFSVAEQESLLFAKPTSAITDVVGEGKTYANNDAYYADEANWAGSYSLSTTEQVLNPRSANVNTTTHALTNFLAVLTVSGNPDSSLTGNGNFLATSIGSPTDSEQNRGYYTESFLVKSTNDTKLYLSNLTSDGSSTLMKQCLRFAIKVTDTQADVNDPQIFTINGPENNQTRKAVVAGSGSFTAAQDVTFNKLYTGDSGLPAGITVQNQTISSAGVNSASVSTYTELCELTANQAREVTVTVWLEGNDARCTNSIMGATLASINFEFSVSSN